jgi:diguanylate cyclase (GGDEF)-like protein
MVQAGRPVDQPITDSVTGAYSRALLMARLEEELERAEGTEGRCSLFLFDVDFFKTVNDAYGHQRGDEVLRQLAERIKGLIRGYDVLFRYGGDEFVVLLPGTDRDAALRMALRITDEVRGREFGADPPLHLSISLGVATFPDDGADADALIACADRRNYLAKRRGRGGAVADDADAGTQAVSSRLWERDTPLAVTQEFLTRLDVEGGALRVEGEPGAGHTRFLEEVAAIARLRGFTVVPVPGPDQPLPAATDEAGLAGPASSLLAPGADRFLLTADVDRADRVDAALARLRAARPDAVVGVAYASTRRPGRPGEPRVRVIASTELLPWSPATVKIWLRNELRGEPNRALVTWVLRDSGGLPARAARGLGRLREAGGLTPTPNGGWTLTPTMLGRPRRRSRLPAPMTSILGREAEQDRVRQLLDGGRLVTLVGPGGIGKTRLGLAVAGAAAEGFDDGAVFVPLADATEPELVLAAVAQALQVTDVPGQSLQDSVVEQLADLSVLLVLDNFEQVIDAAGLVADLLAAGPAVSVLVTSRERLSLYGEQVYHVPPLAVPDPDALPTLARALADYPALALFEQRAAAVTGDFTVSADNLAAVAALCRRLDGLPLAIELAAARIDRWGPDELLEHLAGHLAGLGGGPTDLPARQQTLRGAIDWSFVLLDEADQHIFLALSAFAGGWNVAAAAAVSGCPANELHARLDRLASKSLLNVEPRDDADEPPRFRMLETIRAYAAARLDETGDAGAVRDAHRAYFVAFAGRAAEGMTGPDQPHWAERLSLEYQNMRVAMRRAMAHGRATDAGEICLGLWRYWRTGNHLREGRDWLDQILADPGLPDADRARLLHPAALLATAQDEFEAGYRLAEQSLALAEATGQRPGCAAASNVLGIAAIGIGEYHLAREHFQRTLAIWEELDDATGTAMALGNLAKLSLRLADLDAADGFASGALELERKADNARGIALALECIGQVRLVRGDIAGARGALQESLEISRAMGDVFGEAMALHLLGLAAHDSGDRADALALLTAAVERRFDVGDQEDLAVSLECVAHVVAGGDAAFAATLLGAADGLRERNSLVAPPETETRREATLAVVTAALDPPALASAQAVGRTAPIDLIIDEALDLVA